MINELKEVPNEFQKIIIKVQDNGTKQTIESIISTIPNPSFKVLSIDSLPLSSGEVNFCKDEGIQLVFFGGTSGKSLQIMQEFKVRFVEFKIIYELMEWLEKKQQKGLVDASKLSKDTVGVAVVQKVFQIIVKGTPMRVAGCTVKLGKI